MISIYREIYTSHLLYLWPHQFVEGTAQLLGHRGYSSKHVLHFPTSESGRQLGTQVTPLLALQVEQVGGEGIAVKASPVHEVVKIPDEHRLDQVQIQNDGHWSQEDVGARHLSTAPEGIVGLLEQLAVVHRLQPEEVTKEEVRPQLWNPPQLPIGEAVAQITQQKAEQRGQQQQCEVHRNSSTQLGVLLIFELLISNYLSIWGV